VGTRVNFVGFQNFVDDAHGQPSLAKRSATAFQKRVDESGGIAVIITDAVLHLRRLHPVVSR
jgi:hypothetical protein